MNILSAHRRLAAALLLTAAPFPLTAALAQEAQQPAEAEVEDAGPPADEAPAEAQEPRVVTVAPPAPAAQPDDAAEPPPAARRAPARTAAPAPAQRRATPPPPPRVVASVPAAGLPVAASPAPPPATIEPAAPLPAPTTEMSPPPAATSDAATDPAPAADADTSGENNGPLLLLGALALGGAVVAFLIARKRRRTSVHHHHSRYAEAAAAAQPEPIAAAPLAAPFAAAPAAVAAAPAAPALRPPPAASAAAAVGGPERRPWLQLLMQPVRAGVAEEAARVEFELRVENNGTAPAEDVRISTFMLAAGSPQESQLEQALVEHPSEARLPEAIDPGDTRRIAASVALPRETLGDAVLPVVVADARYTLPDGSEGRTFASYAVGVPWEGDLAHFDVHNPSGLHEGVEARLRGRPTQV